MTTHDTETLNVCGRQCTMLQGIFLRSQS